jgi:hypothetical protein
VRSRDVAAARSMYYYDFRAVSRYFPQDYRLHYQFGDVRTVPAWPTFVKSRPIAGDNQNSVLLKLNEFRHFYFPADPTAFADKKPIAVWRGGLNHPLRAELVRRYQQHPLCDVGCTQKAEEDTQRRAFLQPVEQMRYRYIISIEGYDVASNLKWILASGSLCLMPAPAFETWFMEGRLEAGKHYVRLSPDLSDLEQHIRHYESHPDEALAIIRNANRFVARFRDRQRERLVSLLVMYKYFAATGQLAPDERLVRLLGLA